MFIRKTQTRNKSTSEAYFTHRLAASERTGKQVRQVTLLNLGRHFDLPQPGWPRLCARIGALLSGQSAARCSRARASCSPNPAPSKPWPRDMPPA